MTQIAAKRIARQGAELTVAPETVRMLIEKARMVQNSVQDLFEDGHEDDIAFSRDTLQARHGHEGLIEEALDDMTEEEFRELLEDLNIDEAAGLLAVAWIGRGEYEPHEFPLALHEAQEQGITAILQDLTTTPLLSEQLEAGLDALNL